MKGWRTMMDEALRDYSRMIDDFAWYSQGDIFAIAKLAKKLKRDYMQDITERKKQMLNAQK